MNAEQTAVWAAVAKPLAVKMVLEPRVFRSGRAGYYGQLAGFLDIGDARYSLRLTANGILKLEGGVA